MSDQPTTTITRDDLTDDSLTYKPDAMNALRALARSKPWRGSLDERRAKIRTAFLALADVYGLDAWTIRWSGSGFGDTGSSYADRDKQEIVFKGRPSVVTLLYLVGVARGMQQVNPMIWACTAFKKRFPISFSRCEVRGGLLVNPGMESRERAFLNQNVGD